MASYRYRSRKLLDYSDSSSSESSDSESFDDEESSEESEEDLRGATYRSKRRVRGSGDTTKSGYQIGNIKVTVVGGDIARQKVDAIVNTTNSRLDLSQGRTSSSILAAAGRGIQRECRQTYTRRLDPGEIAVTTGGHLACRAIYHGVLTKYSSKKDEQILADLVTECLDQADADGYRSIAFPPIGTGYLSYNPSRVAEIMLECIENCNSRTVKSVSIVTYSQESSCFQDFVNAAMKCSFSTSKSTSKQSLSSNTKHKPKVPSPVIPLANFNNNINGINVNISVGTLQDQKVDVIVNSIGKDLSIDSAVSSALVSAAGPNLVQELRQTCFGKIPFGFVAVTKGYNLSCKEVFHGALSPWTSKTTGSKQEPDTVLEYFVYKCLKTAKSRGHNSIAFPALGTEQLKFPPDVAAACTVAGIQKFSDKYNNFEVRILLYGGSPDLEQLEKAYMEEMASPGKKVSKAGHSAPVEHFPQYSEPKRGTEAWLAWKYREDLRTPKYWTKYTDTKKLKHWNMGGSSFENVDQATKSSITNALRKSVSVKKIVSIQRLENVGLFQKYGDECQRLFRKASMAGNFTSLHKLKNSLGPVKVMKYLDQSLTKQTYPEINEYFFFHGTKPNAVNLICEQGLDSRLGGGKLGVGVYGAEEASKSHGYTGTNTKGERPMFLVRMCLGDVFLTNNIDTNFRRAPCKKCSSAYCTSHHEMYDSVVANGGAFSDREFVVYDRNQSYPEFLIWYIS
ncbi:protein mono-ADP-ribosyltransferase PARP15-like [Saccostrea cucullata]|uniref:protein mono-ADP-ribosyltransferase PARP15-like n=1 Tax=Saccostrea cuccullata TaxID=36930 RepID=UPI002ED2E3A0